MKPYKALLFLGISALLFTATANVAFAQESDENATPETALIISAKEYDMPFVNIEIVVPAIVAEDTYVYSLDGTAALKSFDFDKDISAIDPSPFSSYLIEKTNCDLTAGILPPSPHDLRKCPYINIDKKTLRMQRYSYICYTSIEGITRDKI